MKKLNKVLEYILAFLVVVMVVGCFWQIFTRFVLNNASSWTEELLRYAPICGVLMIIYSGERLIRFVKELKETKEEK